MNSNTTQSGFTALNEQQLTALSSAASALNKEQLIWASGYLAGLSGAAQASSSAVLATAPAAAQAESATLTILYGSQTGNAKGVANKYKDQVAAQGVQAKVVSMADYKPRSLKNETHLLVVVSTHGEGDAPDDAVELHEFLASKKAPKLPNLQYSVIGLGDTSYEFFCQTAKDFDKRLSSLGATAFAPRLDCDVDYDSAVSEWSQSVDKKLIELLKPVQTESIAQPSAAANAVSAAIYTKQNPFNASLSESLKITGRDSVKDIRHIEISLEDSGITYQAGDALGVYFLNDDSVIEKVLTLTGNEKSTQVKLGDESVELGFALKEKLELTLSYPGFVKAYQAATNNAELEKLLSDKAALREFLNISQIVDVIAQYPAKIDAQALVDAMRPLTPRLYSIASSQAEVEDEVHLTVAHVEYEAHGFTHQGGASGYLSTRLQEGDEVKVYVESNDNFRLPSDGNTPVIMIGPGTGIAPFRAFMQEREASEAEGKNWLFFGNPSFTQDFLYQTEWQAYLKSGLLTKTSLAFSRDQAEKIYVQDRLTQNAKEVFEWLEAGAHFYVCGDATRMAKDVESALLSIIETQGQKSAEDAKAYLTDMRKAKRYQKDVY